ncbi:MAG: ParB/RepB/Spo0J family partition protein [Thermoanaerobaculia bacterium]
MTRKQALGRGLSALLPGGEDVPRGTPLQEVEVERLVTGRYQPRRGFPEERLAELAASIREHGVVQPLVVVPSGEGFEVVAGERRLRAAKLAGLPRVPVIVREKPSDRELLELALVENLQREDLNPIEEAEAYGRLREEFSLTQEQIAAAVGKDRATVANSLRILRLPSSVKDLVRDGALSGGHARALAGLASPEEQQGLAEEVIRRGLSVRQTEARVARLAAGPKSKPERRRDPFTRDAEEKLARRLLTRVRIARGRRGGRIELLFASEEELIGLFERLMGKG